MSLSTMGPFFNLPREILDHIASVLDPSSFALFLLVNKCLRNTILQGDALHHQVRLLPGLHICTQACRTPVQLLKEFNKKAANWNLNGLSVTVDTFTYTTSFKRHKTVQLEAFRNGPSKRMAAVLNQDTNEVHIYALTCSHPVPRFVCKPSELDSTLRDYDVVLFKLHEHGDKKCVTMLLRASKQVEHDTVLKTLIWEAKRQQNEQLILLTCSLSYSAGVEIIDFSSFTIPRSHVSVAMERSANGQFVIACRHEEFDLHRIIVVDPDLLEQTTIQMHRADALITTVVEDTITMLKLGRPIYSMSLFPDGNLWIYAAADQMPTFLIRNCFDTDAAIEVCSTPTITSSDAWFGIHKWYPLSKVNVLDTESETTEAPGYLASVLQLAFVESLSGQGQCVLIKSHSRSAGQSGINIHSPFDVLEHEVVAILDGVDTTRSISHGHVVAVDKISTTIAIATWNRVMLYRLNPSAFLSKSIGSILPRNVGVIKRVRPRSGRYASHAREVAKEDGDSSYSIHCGQGYYRTWTKFFGKRVVCLSPIELPSCGVVTRMCFTGKHSLWAWTDRGLVNWHWGSSLAPTMRPVRSGLKRLEHLVQLETSHVDDIYGQCSNDMTWSRN